VLAALAATVPLAKTMSEKISDARKWAIGRARNASLVQTMVEEAKIETTE